MRYSPRASTAAPRVGLLTRFGVISFVLLLALGLVVGTLLQRSLRERTIADAVRSAEIAARVGITPHIHPDDLQRDFVPLDAERLAEVDARLRASVSDSGIVRMKVWNARHWIVYSDNERLVGRWFATDELLDRSLAGETVSLVTDLSRPQEMEERAFGQLLAVYVPLRLGDDGTFGEDGAGEVVGSFEVYLPYAPIAADIASGTRQLWLILAGGLIVLYLALFRLVAGASRLLRRQSAENERLARADGLTGLDNRLGFRERVDASIGSDPLAVMLADIDRFQEINDTLGHEAGDQVIAALARRLSDAFGDDAIIARPGGDEFLVSVPVGTGGSVEDRVAQLHDVLTRPVEVSGVMIDLTVSVGAAVAPQDADDADTLIRHADVAMYHAKRNRLRTAVYRVEIDAHTPERLALATDVRGGIESGQMFLVYQPKMDIATRAVTGVEALVRWRHPERGVMAPGSFLPLVEGTELIRPLTMEVLRIALDQAAVWRAQGRDLCVAVNLSARVCDDETIAEIIERELAVRRLPPSLLEVELTESALVQDASALATVLERLHAHGVSVAIDDFGTGYASVSYVTSLPVDVVKIDREFVHDVMEQPRHAAVVQFTAALGRTFGMTVVAEGVEDMAMLPTLQSLGVSSVQGFGIARPMEAHALEGWLDRHAALQSATVSAS